MPILCVTMLTILLLLSSICCLTDWRESLVKGGIPGGIYHKPLDSCVIRPGLLIANHDPNYSIIRDSIAIALSAYVDTLGCRLAIK